MASKTCDSWDEHQVIDAVTISLAIHFLHVAIGGNGVVHTRHVEHPCTFRLQLITLGIRKNTALQHNYPHKQEMQPARHFNATGGQLLRIPNTERQLNRRGHYTPAACANPHHGVLAIAG